MCCNGVVNLRPSGSPSYHECCGTVAFNKNSCTCSDGILSCGQCDGEDFDSTNQMCCNGNITPRPDPTCSARENNKCCGSVGFDNVAEMCCNGAVNARPDGYKVNNKCCGQQAFDNFANMCCDGVVNARPCGDPSNHECCGTVAFNQNKCQCNNKALVCI
ncbi:hypothetical protein CAPTEDRAFT_193077 [Capitella teleta]|uniref:Galaxin-like repeats domain-containing protein n=1 Tax=Capitella teleta TaxID=283909 RepID=R7V383_CAPTE|nr:hypothetical protein CAPTEDRAFT_193077 [Capitella teleta]|eukprot:ELU13303.1 hypothetical protein CAPTEDRAFT_193077 [Capitella teleta]